MFIDVDNRVFEDIIYHSQDGIWSIDTKYNFTAINPAAVDLLYKAFGVTFALGNNIREYDQVPLIKPLLDDLENALKGNSFT
ncbi:MAG: hypothetical protein FP831_05615, partial [Anaerolineae bacterium]|nr:hypothetical protein [Anaerolineae bacterium]